MEYVKMINYQDIIADYKMGKDIACLASVYNLTCEEVKQIVGENEDA